MLTRKFLCLLVFILLQGCSSIMPNLGVTNGKLAACPSSPNCVSSQVEVNDKHFIEPIVVKGSSADAHDKVVAVLESSKRTKVVVNEADYIHAEFTSAVFRFVDDVELLFSQERDGEVVVNIRSASRVGHSDFGVNRKRMEAIRSKLQE
ncbi:DUF1499 domain-containing protein [Marinomonas rhizomae]|uniref:Uncharacterized protein (DUF1499 family) n=1 Tax=Marinomonas rhizomae TaxID=491948 RepID=A0A366JGY3_9GAMM|nr:DUF1499 domain-containing protein [Marinomonas rhizomae]RBP85699.1 uncharacterized protein (DUF1499 family) [Marinomonas rhizomae]RNF75677.1 DUF1499 domain-containing protein [Marinomonas rhizomae]